MVDEGVATYCIWSKIALEQVDECVFHGYEIPIDSGHRVMVTNVVQISDLLSIGYLSDVNALHVIVICYVQVVCRLV